MNSVEKIQFWKQAFLFAIEDFNNDNSDLLPHLKELEEILIKKEAEIKKHQHVGSIYDKRVCLSRYQEPIPFSRGSHPSEMTLAHHYFHAAICCVVGFGFMNKGTCSPEHRAELLKFYKEKKYVYFDKECPLELFNVVKYAIQFGDKGFKNIIIRVMAKDILERYGEVLQKYIKL